MDPIEFKRRLEELAEIKQLKAATVSGFQTSRIEPLTIDRNGQTISIDAKNNPTWHVAVKKIKQEARPCDDCGKMVKNRKVFTTQYAFPQSHWRKNCYNCKKTQDPVTKEFSILTTAAQAFFTSYLRKQNK